MYFMLAISTAAAAGKAVVFKKIGVDSKSTKQLVASNALSFLFAALLTLAFSGFRFGKLLSISPFSFLLAVLFAVCMIFTYLTQNLLKMQYKILIISNLMEYMQKL